MAFFTKVSYFPELFFNGHYKQLQLSGLCLTLGSEVKQQDEN
jgi:hypothetical protein